MLRHCIGCICLDRAVDQSQQCRSIQSENKSFIVSESSALDRNSVGHVQLRMFAMCEATIVMPIFPMRSHISIDDRTLMAIRQLNKSITEKENTIHRLYHGIEVNDAIQTCTQAHSSGKVSLLPLIIQHMGHSMQGVVVVQINCTITARVIMRQ